MTVITATAGGVRCFGRDMLFSSFEFVFVFLPLVVAAFFCTERCLPDIASRILLIAASLLFYAYWRVDYVALILASIFFNYLMGLLISAPGNSVHVARNYLVFGVVVNLAVLAYFKYASFTIESLAFALGERWQPPDILLPLAISFFTFQQVAYLVDAFEGRGRSAAPGLVDYSLFVLFFPQLIAGPIVHHKALIPQFAKRATYRIRWTSLSLGLSIFLLGLFKKVVLADTLGGYVDPVFKTAELELPLSAITAWGGMLAYTLQIYFDFSGYSDMAFGLAAMFSIRLPINFFSPYKSRCINQFWRRWNITLGHFFRDYVYRPLGGNRVGVARNIFNLMVVMLLSGLWHGAGWNFVWWGVLHGFAMALATLWQKLKERWQITESLNDCRLYRLGSISLTFIFVMLAWVLFRSVDIASASYYYSALFDWGQSTAPAGLAAYLNGLIAWLEQLFGAGELQLARVYCWANWVILGLVVVFTAPNTLQFFDIAIDGSSSVVRRPYSARQVAVTGLLGAIAILVMLHSPGSEFIYFDF